MHLALVDLMIECINQKKMDEFQHEATAKFAFHYFWGTRYVKASNFGFENAPKKMPCERADKYIEIGTKYISSQDSWTICAVAKYEDPLYVGGSEMFRMPPQQIKWDSHLQPRDVKKDLLNVLYGNPSRSKIMQCIIQAFDFLETRKRCRNVVMKACKKRGVYYGKVMCGRLYAQKDDSYCPHCRIAALRKAEKGLVWK